MSTSRWMTAVAASCAAACAATPQATTTTRAVAPLASAPAPASDADIAAIHASKCGRCHAPPEPKTRTREHLADAFGRHRTRLRLSAEQWAALVDYLGAGEAAAPAASERTDGWHDRPR
ncbi:MAG TPA: hypothetical protein VE987_03440 [Polyangiaceae bacterium]|nr:hypothetical protein [Polyangiaceae bacterium]